MIERSLRKLGAGRSILLDKNGRIIGGNKTNEAADAIGLNDEMIVVRTSGDQLVAVLREDLDLDDPNGKARQLAYADNRAGQVSLSFDPVVIGDDLAAGLDLSDWFNDFDLEAVGVEFDEPEEPSDAEPQISRADELQKEWQVEAGQVWRLPSRTEGQEHRIICGDCTDREVVEKVMGGEVAEMVLTDPPYGMGYSGDRFEGLPAQSQGLSTKRNIAPMIIGDDAPFDPSFLLDMFKKVPEVFVFGFQYYPEKLGRGGVIVWNKKLESEENTIHGDFELCWSKKERNKMAWITWGGFKNKEKGEDRLHTTQKPVALGEWFLSKWSKEGHIVIDVFCGSGFTLIAAENLSRQCRAVEISPAYVAVALQRYKDAFGIEPELIT